MTTHSISYSTTHAQAPSQDLSTVSDNRPSINPRGIDEHNVLLKITAQKKLTKLSSVITSDVTDNIRSIPSTDKKIVHSLKNASNILKSSVIDAKHGRQVEVTRSIPDRSNQLVRVFQAIKESLRCMSCRTMDAVDHPSSDSLNSIGILVERVKNNADSLNINSITVRSNRFTENSDNTIFNGEFFHIDELKNDICEYLRQNPEFARLHDINPDKINSNTIPRAFYLAKPSDKTPGVSAEKIFDSLRQTEKNGGIGPSASLKRYMLCQVLSVHEVNTIFKELNPIDIGAHSLYESGGEIAEKLIGFIANNDKKENMINYLKEPSVSLTINSETRFYSPISVLEFLDQAVVSTSGTGKKISEDIDLSQLNRIQNETENLSSDKLVNQSSFKKIKLISHGPDGGDAQGVLITLGSPIPHNKMGLAASLVYSVTQTFPNPSFSQDQLANVNKANNAFSERAALFNTGNIEFNHEDNNLGRDFLLAHGLIDSTGNVIFNPHDSENPDKRIPVTGHSDTIYFTNSREDNLEHMLKKAMLVNGIMALGKENIINKTSASDQLNQLLNFELRKKLDN